MTVARTQPYVPLEEFLEMEPEPGIWLEWCAGLVYSMSGGSPEPFYGRADASIVFGALHTHAVKRKGKTLNKAITNPVLIVEVLSPATEARDRDEKFEAYKQLRSLKEYVLISQDERRVEVRRRGERGWSIDVALTGETLRLHGQPISIDAIYGP